MNLRKISIVLFSTIGVVLALWFSITLFEGEQKVWVTKHLYSCDAPLLEHVDWQKTNLEKNKTEITVTYEPVAVYIHNKTILIYDSKTEFKKELQQICEGCACGTGILESYLISKKDIPELNKFWSGHS